MRPCSAEAHHREAEIARNQLNKARMQLEELDKTRLAGVGAAGGACAPVVVGHIIKRARGASDTRPLKRAATLARVPAGVATAVAAPPKITHEHLGVTKTQAAVGAGESRSAGIHCGRRTTGICAS